eukprot:9052-Heterococcus_DN1.PRE.1
MESLQCKIAAAVVARAEQPQQQLLLQSAEDMLAKRQQRRAAHARQWLTAVALMKSALVLYWEHRLHSE